MRSDTHDPAGRHRWGGERSALTILAGLAVLIVVAGVGLWVFGGDADTSPPGSADESGAPSESVGLGSTTASSPSRGPAATHSKTYTPGDNPHGAREACGGGFTSVEKLTVASGGTTLGTVHLLYRDGVNCVVTLKAVDIGRKTPMKATLTVKGSTPATESGKFGFYAGPVKREAAATCVTFGGAIDGVAVDSGGWSHCG